MRGHGRHRWNRIYPSRTEITVVFRLFRCLYMRKLHLSYRNQELSDVLSKSRIFSSNATNKRSHGQWNVWNWEVSESSHHSSNIYRTGRCNRNMFCSYTGQHFQSITSRDNGLSCSWNFYLRMSRQTWKSKALIHNEKLPLKLWVLFNRCTVRVLYWSIAQAPAQEMWSTVFEKI